MEIGLFFGSFNPIHTGHLIIANLAYELTSIKEVWFVVSPHNPFKKRSNLLPEYDRMDMVIGAIHDHYHFRASDIEFTMPTPSYTIDTLALLSDKHPKHRFRLIIGEDNLASFPKWKNHDQILQHHGLIVYPRPNAAPSQLVDHKNVEMIEAPLMDISATLIRKLASEQKSVRFLVPEEVRTLIESRGYFT